MALSIVAVALGIGYLAGSLSLLQRVGAGLAAQAGADSERADLVIEGTIADDGPLQQVRRLVPDALVEMVRDIDGVAAVEPRLESKSTIILRRDGSFVVPLGLTERPMGANFPLDDGLNPYRFVGEGRAPRNGSEVVLDRRSARSAEVSVGDEVDIINKIAPDTYTVVGIVTMPDGDLPAGSSLALFDTETARRIFQLEADDNAIAIRVEDGADPDGVAAAIERILFADAEVSTGAEYAEHRQAALAKSFTLIRALLVGFAGLALVVGAFTVANSMALLFDHRRRGFALLRLLGASPPQLVAAATTEAAIGGALAGVAGLVAGLGVGTAIERILQTLDSELPVAGSSITWWIPLVSVGIGVAVTVLTSLRPARDASRTPPICAVTGADGRDARGRRAVAVARWLGIVTGLAAGAAIAGQLLGGTGPALAAAVAGAATGVVLVVVPRLLSSVVAALTTALLRDSRALRRVSSLRSRQARTRAASTTAALLLAAMVVSGLTVISSSFVRSAEGQFQEAVTADLVIDSGTFTNGGLSSDLLGELRDLPSVDAVSGWGPAAVYVGSPLWRAGAVDIASLTEVLDLDMTIERPNVAFGPLDVVISEGLAEQQGLRLGQQVPVVFQKGPEIDATVRGIYRSQLDLVLGDILIDKVQVAANLPQVVDVLAFVKLSPDATAVDIERIEELSGRFGASKVLTPEELVASRAELLRGFARVIQWMLGFSVLLALIGVANTLQLGVNERHRELGLLRAIGATRRQILRLVMAEATALSIVGTAIGVAAGVAIAWAAVRALSDFGMSQFVAPVGTLVLIVIVAIVVGHLAAIVPALRATRIPVLVAVNDPDDGGARKATARVPRRGTDGRAPSTAARSEVGMAMRCYHCGYEPGDSANCVVCGAPQAAPAPVYAAAGTPPPYDPSLDIVDATVVDATVVETFEVGTPPPPPAPPLPPPPPPVAPPTVEHVAPPEPVYVAAPEAPYVTAPEPLVEHTVEAPPAPTYAIHPSEPDADRVASSIFGERPPEPEDASAKSPFGQYSSQPSVTFTNLDQGAAGPEPTPETATPRPAPASVGDEPFDDLFADDAAGAVPGVVADRHGLAHAVARLGAESQIDAGVPFSIAGALLEAGEVVRSAASGSSLGMATVVVLTDRRVLVVSDRRYKPDVEVFPLGPGLTVHGRHANGLASLTFGDHDRLVTVDRISDVAVAVELATAARMLLQ